MPKDDPEDIVIEPSGYSYSKDRKTSYADICLNQFKKCLDEGSKEMTVGGTRQRIIDGQIVEEIVPNQVEIYCKCVYSLRQAYLGRMAEHKDLAIKIDNLDKAIRRIKRQRDIKIKEINRDYLSKSDASLNGSQSKRDKARPLRNELLKKYNEIYIKYKEKLYRDMFDYLSIGMDRDNHFEED